MSKKNQHLGLNDNVNSTTQSRKNLRKKAWVLAAALAGTGFGFSAQATLLVYEPFDYNYFVGSGTNWPTLNNQTAELGTGSNPTGLVGAWSAANMASALSRLIIRITR